VKASERIGLAPASHFTCAPTALLLLLLLLLLLWISLRFGPCFCVFDCVSPRAPFCRV
jgi:hypothetical protein